MYYDKEKEKDDSELVTHAEGSLMGGREGQGGFQNHRSLYNAKFPIFLWQAVSKI